MVWRDVSGVCSSFATVLSSALVARSALPFFFIGSRGSSWHRCPMSRLIHRVHGRSCMESAGCPSARNGTGKLPGHKSYATRNAQSKLAIGSI